MTALLTSDVNLPLDKKRSKGIKLDTCFMI